ncbi:putative LRR receptor-like serine/threonine-protein kinase [Glycine soja]|uniref:Putative LRR receptor-like serine/threonine-protein kinase n=1 Tax=Glycine soja TaxID=3848 RepID=A0A445LZK5_GLYSO|nr:putative LRR receptor-like serine/threonine-protein kinase [Glycine soja]
MSCLQFIRSRPLGKTWSLIRVVAGWVVNNTSLKQKLQANDHGYLANQTTVKKSRSYLFPAAIILVLLTPSAVAQLSPSEGRILFQVQKLLEYPQALEGWNRWTNLCFFPSSHSLKIVCSNGHVTELTIIGIICCIYFSYTN